MVRMMEDGGIGNPNELESNWIVSVDVCIRLIPSEQNQK